MSPHLQKGTALVTGASSGIGEAFARLLATKGINLILTARRQDRLQVIAEELTGPIRVDIIKCDLSEKAGAERLIKAVEDLNVTVDILVNNAAVSGQSSFIDTSEDDLDELLVLNIRSLTQLTRYFLPGMKKRKLGKILNVASIAAFHPLPSLAQYAASKAYVLSLSEALAEELRGTGITVTALCPGVTLTQMVSGTTVSQLPETLVSTAEGVAQAGFDAMMDEQVVHIPGLVNEAAVMLSQLQPRRLIRNLGGLFARFNKGG
ncbi:MAG: SDR family oxidoreductase [Pseudomonadales bacterium]|nr:SDR family oxidoreductase [Pseudomonadales bacterium]